MTISPVTEILASCSSSITQSNTKDPRLSQKAAIMAGLHLQHAHTSALVRAAKQCLTFQHGFTSTCPLKQEAKPHTADPQTTSRHIPTSPDLGRGAIELLLLALGLIQCHRKKSSAWAVQGHGISTILPAPHPSSGSPDEGASVTHISNFPALALGTGWLFPAGCLGSRRDPGAFRRSFTRITACFSPGVFEWLLPAPGGSLWASTVEAVAGLTLMHWRTQVSVTPRF